MQEELAKSTAGKKQETLKFGNLLIDSTRREVIRNNPRLGLPTPPALTRPPVESRFPPVSRLISSAPFNFRSF